MIAFIRGQLLAAWEGTCIIATNSGLGYEMSLPLHAYASLPETGGNVEFYLSLVTREDAQELFGFSTLEEKRTFEILTGISRVGARTALAMLSVFRPADLCEIAQNGDYRKLASVPGIGLKTAQHIFLELKYKLKKPGFITANASPAAAENSALSSVFADALAALANLGYQEDECAPDLREILQKEPDLDTASAIRQMLKALAKGKNNG